MSRAHSRGVKRRGRLRTPSEIKISVAIDAKYAELAVRVLHEEFIEKEVKRRETL